jgi:hypothetical protein
MSFKMLVAAALAGGAALLSLHGSAMAQSACNGTVRHFARTTWQCYWLPTVSDGRVTGLQKHVNVHLNYGHPNCRSVPIFTGSGRSLGTRWICT